MHCNYVQTYFVAQIKDVVDEDSVMRNIAKTSRLMCAHRNGNCRIQNWMV